MVKELGKFIVNESKNPTDMSLLLIEINAGKG
jgi:hypothetical protein